MDKPVEVNPELLSHQFYSFYSSKPLYSFYICVVAGPIDPHFGLPAATGERFGGLFALSWTTSQRLELFRQVYVIPVQEAAADQPQEWCFHQIFLPVLAMRSDKVAVTNK